jgi:hypothetical protein
MMADILGFLGGVGVFWGWGEVVKQLASQRMWGMRIVDKATATAVSDTRRVRSTA